MNASARTSPMTKPTHKKGRERRILILEKARARLIEQGVNGLILREIAEEMGITHGNLQYYFKTKNDLLWALFDEEVQKYTTGLHESVRSASSVSGKISAIIESGFDQLKTEDTKLWRALFAVAEDDPDFADILKRQNEYYDQTLAQVLSGFAPKLTEQRRGHVAKVVRFILDGASIDFIYADPNAPEVIGLKSEIKVLLATLLAIE